MTSEEKRAFRRDMLTRRRNFPAVKLGSCSRFIARRITASEEYKNADTLLCFIPTEIEVDTHFIIDRAFADGKKVATPRCAAEDISMDFFFISGYSDLHKGKFDILEPREQCEECTDFSHSLCITPALCCGKDGSRMGYGRGYYDRFLKRYDGVSCAVIFEDFLFDSIPCEPTDVPVMMTVTENTIYRHFRG